MKKTFIVLASLMVMICMICSCGGGSGSASASDVVAVSLGVNIKDNAQKMIEVHGQSIDGATFWYKAHPQWTGTDFATPQGKQETWAKLNNFSMADYDQQTVGYFAQGSWKFEVQVTLGATADTQVLYQTKALANIDPVYINAQSKQFTITVEKVIDNSENGTIEFDIDVPMASASDKFVISYYPIDDNTHVTTYDSSTATQTTISRTTASNIATFKTSALDIPAGFYIVTTDYYIYEASTYTKTRSQSVAAEIVSGGAVKIDGTLENGTWQSTSFTIKGIKSLTATVAISTVDPEMKVGEDVEFTCTPTTSGFDSAPTPTIVYEWRVDGAVQAGETASTFTWTQTLGDHYVTGIAYVQEGGATVVSASNTVKFTTAE